MRSLWLYQVTGAEAKTMKITITNQPIWTGKQQGATLIEILVTMLVVAIGLLGAGGLQLAATRYQQTAQMRSQAMVQMQFITEKIRANNSVLASAAYIAADSYTDAATYPVDPGCGLSGQPVCNALQSAQKDLRLWRELLVVLPGGRGSIFPITTGGITDPLTRQVVVMWQEKQQSETGVIGGPDPDQAATDPTCPAPQVAGVRCVTMLVSP